MSWIPYAVQAASSVIGNIFGERSRRQAEEDMLERMHEARAEAGKLSIRDAKRFKRAMQKGFDKAGLAAKRERKIVAKDEANRFVRLRESADAAGFNPLTLLASGYTGSALPTGILSPDQVQAHYMEQATNTVNYRLQRNDQVFGQLMGGAEAAQQAGAAAYDRTNNLFRDLGDAAAGFAQAQASEKERAEGYALERERIAMDRERLQMDREQLTYERDYNERALAASSLSNARGSGFGASRVASVSEPLIGGGVVENGNAVLRFPGQDYQQNPAIPSAQQMSENMPEMAATVAGDLWHLPETIDNWEAAIRYNYNYIVNGITNRTTRAGRHIGAIRDAFSMSPPSAQTTFDQMIEDAYSGTATGPGSTLHMENW